MIDVLTTVPPLHGKSNANSLRLAYGW